MLIKLPKIAHLPPQHIADALLHFPRGLIGESDCQDRRRIHSLADQIRHAPGQDARFAAAGSGNNQERTVGVGRRLPLWRRKVIQ